MFLSSIILSILIASLRGGRLSRFAEAELRKVGWIILSFGIRFALSYAAGSTALPASIAALAHISAYGMIIYAVVCNRRLRGMLTIGVGTALNLAVIAANGGKMPIGMEGLRRAGLDLLPSFQAIAAGSSFTHQIVGDGTRVAFLGDVLCIPRPLWPPTVFSVGDILVVLGAFALVQALMLPAGRRAPVGVDGR